MNDEFGTPIPPIEEAQGSNNKRIWIIIAVVVVVLCCCCLAFAVLLYFLGDPLLEAIEDYSWAPLLLASIL